MVDFEKLGLFYLGKPYDPQTRQVAQEPLLYDSRDLVTHAVCVGMTGSGKTGLCISLVEEAAIDGVPVLAIDPKGDLANLCLTFPGLSAEEFAPWIDENEARRAGRTPGEHAAAEAHRWRQGLAEWGQDGARIERLKRAADVTIYTPGSTAGEPVSILRSFAAPPPAVREDAELLGELAGNTATSVLGLAGSRGEPRTREHTLVATLLAQAWRNARDLTIADLIHDIQSPPLQKIGVVDLELFYPATERFELAMQLNGLLAAPGFARWFEGAPLDPGGLLYTPEGRPRIAIVSIAHLNDAERMFLVSLLLNQVVGWMRRQSGTASLRAIVYMDEVMGYFPPVAQPPSKAALLNILKQGRAFGVGAVLATQNPVDLDYKGLGNAGTWFVGRLQTDRDKERVLDGLESASAGGLDRAEADRLLSGLDKRVFLLHNVHEAGPVLFKTRWTMSYLRGPMGRAQISRVQGSRFKVQGSAEGSEEQFSAVHETQSTDTGPPGQRPVIPPEIQQLFVPGEAGAGERYSPVILAAATVEFSDAKLGIAAHRDVLYAVPVSDGAVDLDWSRARELDVPASALEREPRPGRGFAEVPSPALDPKRYAAWERAFKSFVGRHNQLSLLRDPELHITSRPGESERDVRIRVQDAQRAARDEAVEALRKKYAPRQARLADQIQRAQAAVERESAQASQARLQTAVSVGATIFGALFGRRRTAAGSVGRATTAARGMGRSMKEAGDIKRAEERVAALREREKELEAELAREIEAITDRFGAERQLERIALRPRRGHTAVRFVALGWMPGRLAT